MRVIPSSVAVLVVALATGLAAPAAARDAPRAFDGTREVASDASVAEPEPVATPASPTAPAAAPATPPTAASTSSAPAKPAIADAPQRDPYPRLVIAGGPLVGPHAFGTEECRAEERRCETHGTFFGFGVNLELRVRLFRALYGHARGLLVGNVSPRDPVYRGLYGGGIGLGGYGRRVFGRVEYLLVDAFGDDHFERPFGEEVGRDRWGHHAGLFSAGARLPFGRRMTAELWGGLMLGPRSTRTIPEEDVERRPLVTFLVGLNIAYDLLVSRR